jgi:hypothetical protein
MRRGRPTAYQPEFAEQARKLCQLGATDIDLADFFLVTDRTIRGWQNAHAGFKEAIEHGRQASQPARRVGEHGGRQALKVALDHPIGHRGRKASPAVLAVPPAAMSRARMVVAETPDLVSRVLGGELAFERAFREAMRRRTARAGAPG